MIVTKTVRAEIRNRRATSAMVDGKEVPGSIPFLLGLLATTSGTDNRDELLGELAGEYLRAEMEDAHLVVQRERLALQPDSSLAWLGLALSLSMRSEAIGEARSAAAKGLEQESPATQVDLASSRFDELTVLYLFLCGDSTRRRAVGLNARFGSA